MSKLSRLVRNLLRRDRVDRDLDDELRSTVDELIAEKRTAGASEDQARRAALIELGGIESVKQQVRDVRSGALLDTIAQDLRYGWRLLVRNPLFTASAALSLAIGIAATTSIFTVANGLLLRAAPGVADPGRLIDIVPAHPSPRGFVEPIIPYTDYLDIRRHAQALSAVYGYDLQVHPAGLEGRRGVERVVVSIVTANYFTALGVRAVTGRVFGASDGDQEGTNGNLVLSHGFWVRGFGADASVVGRTVRINGTALTVRGVAAPEFRGMSVLTPDIWIPVTVSQVVQPGRYSLSNRFSTLQLTLGARLQPGMSIEQAAADLSLVAQAIGREHPNEPTRRFGAAAATPVPQSLRAILAILLSVLLALVSILLLIACSNVAAVLLARATSRRREIAVRSALGAARARLLRQLMTETLLLVVLGGTAGIVLARVLTTLLMLLLPALPLPVHVSVPLDWRVVGFAVAVSLLAAVVAGLAPALHAARADVVSALKDESQGPANRLRLRSLFVTVQLAFSVLLVVAAGLFGRALQRTVAIDRGFDAQNVTAISLDLTTAGYTAATGPLFTRSLLDRIRAIPGVEQAALADRIPDGRPLINGSIRLPDGGRDGEDVVPANWNSVEPGYFNAVRIPLIAGRDFTSVDQAGRQRVAIVDEATARRLWPGEDPLGKPLEAVSTVGGMLRATDGPPRGAAPGVRFVIVGVARSLPGNSAPGSSPLFVYVPLQQRYVPQIVLLARAGSGDVTREIATVVAAMNPRLPLIDARSVDAHTSPAEQQLKIAAAVAGSVGFVGLLLAAVGVYGVTAYAVAQRTREFGIRLSLGAQPRGIVVEVLRRGMTLIGIGCGLGLLLSLGAGRLLARSPFQVAAFDPVALGGAVLLFTAVGLIACYIPVRRAVRIRAIEALRYE